MLYQTKRSAQHIAAPILDERLLMRIYILVNSGLYVICSSWAGV